MIFYLHQQFIKEKRYLHQEFIKRMRQAEFGHHLRKTGQTDPQYHSPVCQHRSSKPWSAPQCTSRWGRSKLLMHSTRLLPRLIHQPQHDPHSLFNGDIISLERHRSPPWCCDGSLEHLLILQPGELPATAYPQPTVNRFLNHADSHLAIPEKVA